MQCRQYHQKKRYLREIDLVNLEIRYQYASVITCDTIVGKLDPVARHGISQVNILLSWQDT